MKKLWKYGVVVYLFVLHACLIFFITRWSHNRIMFLPETSSLSWATSTTDGTLIDFMPSDMNMSGAVHEIREHGELLAMFRESKGQVTEIWIQPRWAFARWMFSEHDPLSVQAGPSISIDCFDPAFTNWRSMSMSLRGYTDTDADGMPDRKYEFGPNMQQIRLWEITENPWHLLRDTSESP